MAVIFIRTFLFYALTIFSLRIMGKRQIGELEPTELVVTILISELATIPIQDIEVPLLYAVIPIFALVAFEMFSSVISLKSMRFRSFLSGGYSVIIENGVVDQKEMTRAQLTLDELMEELRQNGALRLSDVRFCVLETSGKMSVLLKKDVKTAAMPVPVVVDGKPVKKNIKKLGLTNTDIADKIKENNVEGISQVFWMTLCGGEVSLIKKDEN